MGANERANQRLQAWVEAQRREQYDETLDQGQQPQQEGVQDLQHGQNYHEPQTPQPPRLPYPVPLPEEQQNMFQQTMYRALKIAQPLVHEQHARQQANLLFNSRFGFPQQQQSGQPQVPQLYDERYQQHQLRRREHEQFLQQQRRQSPQHARQQANPLFNGRFGFPQQQQSGQPQGPQLYHDTHYQQHQLHRREHEQSLQQQRQQSPQHRPQQQAPQQLLRQPQIQPPAQTQSRRDQPQSEHNREKGPASFSTKTARYFFIRRVAISSEGTVTLTNSISKSNSTPTRELRIVKSVPSDGTDPRESHIIRAAGSHPNVLKLLEVVFDETLSVAHMCMEYCSGGDLHNLLCSYGIKTVDVPDHVILKAVIDISDGLAFLHGGWVRDERTELYGKKANAPLIIHRDLVRCPREETFNCCQYANVLYRKPRTSS